MFRLVDEWFIRMDELRHAITEVTRQIRWIPAFGLDRELDWLHNMHDWMISKKRYWGLALPFWECAACGNYEVIGDERELEARAVEGWEAFQGHTPHRPFVDAVKIACPGCGRAAWMRAAKTALRVEERCCAKDQNNRPLRTSRAVYSTTGRSKVWA